jgi:hypothetical protein
MEEKEPTITMVSPDPENRKILVVYRYNIPDELVTPTVSVKLFIEDHNAGVDQEWVITNKERVRDEMERPDGYYVTYEPPGSSSVEEEEEEEGELN